MKSTTITIKVSSSPAVRKGQPYIEITEPDGSQCRYWRRRRGEWRTPHGRLLSSHWAAVAEEEAGKL